MRTRLATGLSVGLVACGGTQTDGAPDAAPSGAVLQFGITVHLEARAPYEQSYLDRLREYGTFFKDHGGKLTLEPREEMWAKVTGPNADLFRDLEAQGHAFAVHAALGNVPSYDAFVAQLARLRTDLAAKNVKVEHASGQCQNHDWVAASVAAGYLAMTGGTENCLLALAPQNRPPGYENVTCAKAAECHGIYPQTTAQRIHPWRARAATDWLTDHGDGKLVILPSSGTLPCLEEEKAHPDQLSPCTFTQADIALSKSEIDAALALVDKDKINQLYFVWSFGLELSSELLEAWFSMLKPYVDQGKIVWKTATEVHDNYVVWEKTHR